MAATTSTVLALLWIISAAVISFMPRAIHWRGAYVLIATALPLAAFVFCQNGLIWGLLFLGAAVSVLRWPLKFLARWLGRKLGIEVSL